MMDQNENTYKNRRLALAKALPDTLIIIPAADLKTRSYDTQYPFRQDSTYRYYTGINEPDGFLVIVQKNNDIESHLFTLDRDPLLEQWNGIRLGLERAKEYSEADFTHPLSQFDQKITDLMLDHSKLALDLTNQGLYAKFEKDLQKFWTRSRGKVYPTEIIHLAPHTGAQRLIKEQNEIQFIKKAVKLTARAHMMAMAKAAPGVGEDEIENTINFIFGQNGATGPAYGNIVAGGTNALILHYIENNQKLKDGDLLLIDAGAEFAGYASDVTRTYPVNGKFTEAQKEVYLAVLDAQKNAISHCSPGNNLVEINNAACRVLADFLIRQKIIKGSVDEVIENGELKKYYPHNTGHWMGLDVHDPSPYFAGKTPLKLAPGMIFTVEPGLYFPLQDPNVPKEFQGIGIRIEDDILINEKGHENLTASIPKEIKEVEAICNQDYLSYLSD